MKKLISLILLALISTQMWAVYKKITFSYTGGTLSATHNGTTVKSGSTYQDGKIVIFTATPSSGNTIIAWNVSGGITLSNCTIGTNTLQFTMPSSDVTIQAVCRPPISNQTKKNGTTTVMIAYDMGTPSNIAWGDRALGSSAIDRVGSYYRYGLTSSVAIASSRAKYSYSGVYTDSNSLPADMDMATEALGEGWRIPTQSECNELLARKTTTTFKKASQNGNTFTAVLNNNTIYFYYGGWYNSTGKQNCSSSGNCYYWTSTKCSDYSYPTAYCMNIGYTTSNPYVGTASTTERPETYYALQVKPVYDPQNYTLTVKGKDGSTTLKTQNGKWGSTVTVTAPTVTGYTFEKWNDGNTSNPRDFKVCNITYTAIYKSSSVNYTVKHYKQNLALNGYDEVTADQQTLSGTPGASTLATAKSYTGFTAQSISQGTINADGSTVVNIYYNRDKYTVTIESNNTSYGTVDVASVANVPYGTTITTSTNTIDVNGTTVTATPATVTGYTCTFNNWTNGTATVTGALTVTANFTQTANNYSVTFRKSADDQNPAEKSDYHYGDEITNCPSDLSAQKIGFVFTGWYLDGAVPEVRYTSGMTVTGNMIFTARYSTALSITIPAYENHGKVLVHTIDRTYTVTSDGNEDEEKIIYVASGSRITIEPVADAYFHFAGWTPNPGEYLDGNFIEIDNVQSNITYTPTWEQNVTLSLVDTENKAYYTDLYSNATYAGKMLTVTMTGRRLTAGSWMTFCAPFEFDIPAGHALDGAVYRFINGTMTGTNTEGYISLDFVRTHKIEANVPYLVVAKTTTDTDLEFDGVTIEDAPEQKPVKASSGDVQFVSQPWKDALVNEALELADFYIASGNTLRYAKVGDPGTTIRAFRAYFHRLRDLNATPAPRRIVISLDGVETTKEIGVDGEIEDTTRKYMENGILYIERNGVRYDAQGQRAE